MVVDGVNKCPDRPDHCDQKQIAAEYKEISNAGFDNSLCWRNRRNVDLESPIKAEAGDAGKKFGLNM